MDEREKSGDIDEDTEMNARPYLMGQVAASINDVKPAKEIIDEMLNEAAQRIQRVQSLIGGNSARL